jgi:hypothetical protein
LRKNWTTLVAKIAISRQFSDFCEKLKRHRFALNFVGLISTPRGRSSFIYEKINAR